MRAEDVIDTRFTPTRFRAGYDQDQVDDLLDRITATFAAAEQGRGPGPLTADEVVAARFQPTKFREGYDQGEVDDFLAEVVVALRAAETPAAG
jgi:DivIVA domain-containing protein